MPRVTNKKPRAGRPSSRVPRTVEEAPVKEVGRGAKPSGRKWHRVENMPKVPSALRPLSPAWHIDPDDGTGKDTDTESAKKRSARRGINFLVELDKIRLDRFEDRSIENLTRKLNIYVNLCHQYNRPLGNMQMCYAIGVELHSMESWRDGIVRGLDPAYHDFAVRAYAMCSTSREIAMQDGVLDKAIGIFWQKNYDGLRDDRQLTIGLEKSPDDNALPSKEQLKEKYLQNLAEPSLIEAAVGDDDNDEDDKDNSVIDADYDDIPSDNDDS